ncbi:hypothetical protein PR202_gb28821 [Eleusine coracana subsp. coracana]|uniref:Uncharacterized protein n=1 Tax=Eleusine coracana subsp. coracana TaxID=191504 RepID=A0AAV5FXG7_ELECO|nr:hypothetical protein PR202_gb28821 [Eleusine coracana subsp. coracana]
MLQHGLHELLPQVYTPAALVSLLLFVCPLVLVILVRRSFRATESSRREQLLSNLPSPPGKLPIIGHLHLVSSLPNVSLRDLSAKHSRNGIMLLRLGAVPTLVVSSPGAAQAVLRTYDHVFSSRPPSPITDILFYGSTDIAFCPYGEHWRQVKKIATTHLLSNKKVRSYCHAREQEVRLVMTKIHEAAAAGTAIDLSELLNSFANDIICHAVSGKFFREEGRNKLFRELVDANSRLLGGFNPITYFPVLEKLDVIKRMLLARTHKVQKIWDDLLTKLIDDHACKPASQIDGEESDFIDVLLSVQDEYQLTRDHIKAVLEVIFEGGTDTSSLVVEYAMCELMQNPSSMSKLQADVRNAIPQGKEIVTEDDVNSVPMPYLKAVVKETLRLHGVAPLLLPHFSMADCEIGGYTIPSRTRTLVNVWAIARDPSYWECAEDFMPERFMEGGSAANLDYMGNDFLFLPFGSGRRRCPGINMGIPTVEVMLANLVYHYNWKLSPELEEKGIDMTESFGVTLHRTEKLPLVPIPPQVN